MATTVVAPRPGTEVDWIHGVDLDTVIHGTPEPEVWV